MHKELVLVSYWPKLLHGIKELNASQELLACIQNNKHKDGKKISMLYMLNNQNYSYKSFMVVVHVLLKQLEVFNHLLLHNFLSETIIVDWTFHMTFPKQWHCKILKKQKMITETASNLLINADLMEFNYMALMDIWSIHFYVHNQIFELIIMEDQ